MDSFKIPSLPDSMYYIHDFISEEEEALILQKIPANRWISLSHRRLQAIPATLTATNTLLASPLPEWLTKPIFERFDKLKLFEDAPHGVNHCLINEYLPGQGIMPHEDGAAYHPIVATVSLGGTIVLDVDEKARNFDDEEGEKFSVQGWRILQEPRSLLVTTSTAYSDTLHGIADVEEDVNLNESTVANWGLLGDSSKVAAQGGFSKRNPRISLTYRDVKRVSKIGSKLFGKART